MCTAFCRWPLRRSPQQRAQRLDRVALCDQLAPVAGELQPAVAQDPDERLRELLAVLGDHAVTPVADGEAGGGARGGDDRQAVGERLDELQWRASALEQGNHGAGGARVGCAEILDE